MTCVFRRVLQVIRGLGVSQCKVVIRVGVLIAVIFLRYSQCDESNGLQMGGARPLGNECEIVTE